MSPDTPNIYLDHLAAWIREHGFYTELRADCVVVYIPYATWDPLTEEWVGGGVDAHEVRTIRDALAVLGY